MTVHTMTRTLAHTPDRYKTDCIDVIMWHFIFTTSGVWTSF